MMMEQLLPLFIFIPLFGFVISLFFRNTQEKQIAGIAVLSIGLQLLGVVGYSLYWILLGKQVLENKFFVFYKEADIEIYLDFYFDSITAIFSILGAFVSLLVLSFSKYYLHRDSGFKRFFNTVLLFYCAYNITIFAGNFETLFIGWEFLGITSFLLISFYRDRYLPVKNALKTISLYRLGDMCLILALWTSHHIWHQNITFMQLNETDKVLEHIAAHPAAVTFLLAMLLAAASIKSAQFPFSSWLPRAMEGPTTSSAVFYGSLAIHIGAFLLLRTYAYWYSVDAIQIATLVIGVATAFIANAIARVQSTVKTQIAYASVAQIGLIFVEIALGWHTLALLHICGNALLRTYQLLVSPSVLGYRIHDQVFNFKTKNDTAQPNLAFWRNSFYLLNVKEWNMDSNLKNLLWKPFKSLGKFFHFFSNKIGISVFILIWFLGLFLLRSSLILPDAINTGIHLVFAFIGMILVLLAFVERESAMKGWVLIILSQFYVVISIALLNDAYEYVEILLYCIGLLFAALVGLYVLFQLKQKNAVTNLNDFYGQIQTYPKQGTWFLIACLAFVGLPFTPTFIGLDLMYTHIDHEEYILVTLITISFLVLELAVLRIYARLFLGPGKNPNHPIAYRSS